MNEKEQPQPFSGQISLESELPIDVSSLPRESQHYVDEDKGMKRRFVVAREDNDIVGFAVLLFPEDENKNVEFRYRYVMPDHRRRGIGKLLRKTVYKSCREAGFSRVVSGINNVIKILPDGTVVENMSADADGGWKSYRSMTSNLDLPLSHQVAMATVQDSGYISIVFETQLDSEETHVMPATVEGLMDNLRQSTFPPDLENTDLLKLGFTKKAVAFENGRELSFEEYMARMVGG